MKRTRKVYLPLWMAWFAQVFILPAWGFVTYETFFVVKEQGDASLGGWLLMTFFFAGISAMLLLMGYRKLPTHVIEEEDEK